MLSWMDGNNLRINVNNSFNKLMRLFTSYSNCVTWSLSINPPPPFFSRLENMFCGFGYLEVLQLFGIKWTLKSKNTWYGLLCQRLDVLRWLTFRSIFVDYNSPVCLQLSWWMLFVRLYCHAGCCTLLSMGYNSCGLAVLIILRTQM